MKIKAVILALHLPSLGLASVYNYQAFSEVPDSGLNNITFPIGIKGATRQSGYYFAQDFNFNGINNVGYTGIQPRPDSGRRQVVRALFYSFENGTTTSHKNCHLGADGGPGISYSLNIFGDYSHLYKITVKNTGDTTWRATLVNTVTRKSDVIGQWTLPSAAGKIRYSQVSFVKYFNGNDRTFNHDYSKQPFSQVFFGNPTSKIKGASSSKITSIFEGGECVRKLNLKTTQTGQGYHIQVGFK